MNIIEINGLQKKYSTFSLNIPELFIQKGEIVGFVGNNGAGKTTLFRLLLDLIRRDTGDILIESQDILKADQWRRDTACFLDEGFLLDYLNVKEFLEFKANIYNISADLLEESLCTWEMIFRDDKSVYTKLIKNLSTGNKQKVGIISAAMLNPKILILDEPFNYLDPSSQVDIMKLLKKQNKDRGTTILLSSHNLEYISEISSRVILLEEGSIKADLKTGSDNVFATLKDYFYSCSQI